MNKLYHSLCLFACLFLQTILLAQNANNTLQISSINTQNFPFVFLNVTVTDGSNSILDLDPSLFSVCENGVVQTDFFEVIPPNIQNGGGANNRLADIVFIVDNSGSLSDEQAAIRQNLNNFVGQLENSGIDFALGLARYGQDANGGFPILEENGNLTTDAAFFRDVVFARNRTSGGNEPGYEAILDAARGFNFRPGAQRVFVIITDETPNQSSVTSQQATDIAVTNSITIFALTEQSLNGTFTQVTMETNGQIFNIFSSFDFILEAISQQLSNSYLVRYQSSQPMRNGQERLVEVKVNLPTGRIQDAVDYTPGAIPIINLDNATKALFEQAFDPGTALEIAAIIMDESAPFVQEAQLFYQNEGDLTFQQIPMVQDAGTDVWRATIPQGFANTPSVNFYIVASDNVTSVTLPSVDPMENPFQIAILPNIAPTIQHTPIEMASINSDLTIIANVQDATQFVANVTLFYRELGDILFQEVPMSNNGGGEYTGIIPSMDLTCAGTEYYIEATDDQGVSSLAGTIDNPFFFTGLTEECSGGDTPEGPLPNDTCAVVVTTSVNSILINGLTDRHNRIIVYDPSFTNIIREVTYEEDVQGSFAFEGLPIGDYAVKIQSFTVNFAAIRCDFVDYVTVTDMDSPVVDCPNLNADFGDSCDDNNPDTENDSVQTDCTCSGTPVNNGMCNVIITIGPGAITFDNLNDRHNRIILFDENLTTIIGEVAYEEDVQGSFTFEGLPVGRYAIHIQSFTDNFAAIRCDMLIFEEIVEVGTTGEEDPGNGGDAEEFCDHASASGNDGVLTIGGLTAPIEIVDVFDENYNPIYNCFANCGDFQTVENLLAGDYFVQVKAYDEGFNFLCVTTIPVHLERGATSRQKLIDGLQAEDVDLYPNPAKEQVTLNLDGLQKQAVQISIYNSFSQKVWEQNIKELQQAKVKIDLSSFSNGLHFLYVQPVNKRPISKKLMISRLY